MTIILPGGADPHDEMVQRAVQAEKNDQKIQGVVSAIQNQIFTTTFTTMAMEHYRSGEPLTLEVGREIANAAENAARTIINGYAGFLYEKLGFATMNKVEEQNEKDH